MDTPYSHFLEIVSEVLPQRKGTIIFAIDESNKLIRKVVFNVVNTAEVTISGTGELGVYTLVLADKNKIYDLQIAFSAEGFMSQKRCFLVADQTKLCIRAGKESDLYLSHNTVLYPLNRYAEFLELISKSETERNVPAFSEPSVETKRKTFAIRQKFKLTENGPVRRTPNNPGNSKINGLVLPHETALREKVLNALKNDKEMMPAALYFLWNEGEEDEFYELSHKTVEFNFPESTSDEHIRQTLRKADFEVTDIIPSSHRLNAPPGKLVYAHYENILSLDMIRKASKLVTEGEVYDYSLKRTGRVKN